MAKPREVLVAPGALYFGNEPLRVRTLLGSCVSLVAWHPQRHLGGMSHFLLPSRKAHGQRLDGRYGDESFALMLAEMRRFGAAPQEFRLGLYGGADMFGGGLSDNIGKRNAELALALLQRHKLVCQEQDLGGRSPRTLIFDVGTGQLTLRLPPSPPSNGPMSREVMS